MSEEWCCPICLEDNEEDCYILQPCNHKFHTKCIIDSLRLRGRECPCCRGIQTTSSNLQNISINDMELFNTYVAYDNDQNDNLSFGNNSNLNIIDISGIVNHNVQIENLPFGGTQNNYVNSSNLNIDVISSINPNVHIIDTSDNETSSFVRSMDAMRNNEIRNLNFNGLSNMFNNLDRLQVDHMNNAIERAMGGNGRGY